MRNLRKDDAGANARPNAQQELDRGDVGPLSKKRLPPLTKCISLLMR